MKSFLFLFMLSTNLWVNGSLEYPFATNQKPLLLSAVSRVVSKLDLQQDDNNNALHDNNKDNRRQLQRQISRGAFKRACPLIERDVRKEFSSIHAFGEGAEEFRCVCNLNEFSVICGFANICAKLHLACESLNYCLGEYVKANIVSGIAEGVSRVDHNASDPNVSYSGFYSRIDATITTTETTTATEIPLSGTCEMRNVLAQDGLEYTCNSCKICESSGTLSLDCTNIQPAGHVSTCEINNQEEEEKAMANSTLNPLCLNGTALRPTTPGVEPVETNRLFETLQQEFAALSSSSRTGMTIFAPIFMFLTLVLF